MCGAVNMLPGTAGVSWCSMTLRGRVFTCVELSTCYQVLLVLVGVQMTDSNPNKGILLIVIP